ncbi:gamma-glutamylcyclotransferase family protein [Spartinivicinus poritis]|uniref:Gamma-glutamylcyclotransferase n=1 Tax=Spartinivicinus poritis TaxID=2994640 RepID=A0ABT5UEC1_9GAMM|nr:gamma-glutamylcyclotransferase family protein [Spartinivicinus sp. A2-2]MDE1464535.1 gamma-glutamylcyclotransferase [Spartinivicinus sp. A2-2]
MLYFAYGSNMSVPRLQQRIGDVSLIDIAKLRSYQLRFHKCGMDGSGKCDAYYTGNNIDYVWGTIYQLESNHKHQLDKIEGLGKGYLDKIVRVINPQGKEYNAVTYYATCIDDSLIPFDWYKTHVVYGAKSANLPSDYVQMILSVSAIKDANSFRTQQELLIYK